jgi:hypothetical protein
VFLGVALDECELAVSCELAPVLQQGIESELLQSNDTSDLYNRLMRDLKHHLN